MPDVRPLTIVPNAILRTVCKPIVWDKKTSEIVTALQDTVMAQTNPQGVGLSAPQIGKNARLFVTWLSDDPEADPSVSDLKVYGNPVLTGHSTDVTLGPDPEDPILEGCLSIPKIYGPVPRYEWVEISYETIENGKMVKKEERAQGFVARVIQHEFDHLEGVLFTDYSLKYDLPVYEYIGKKLVAMDKEVLEAF